LHVISLTLKIIILSLILNLTSALYLLNILQVAINKPGIKGLGN